MGIGVTFGRTGEIGRTIGDMGPVGCVFGSITGWTVGGRTTVVGCATGISVRSKTPAGLNVASISAVVGLWVGFLVSSTEVVGVVEGARLGDLVGSRVDGAVGVGMDVAGASVVGARITGIFADAKPRVEPW
jgi:hypothetical protein